MFLALFKRTPKVVLWLFFKKFLDFLNLAVAVSCLHSPFANLIAVLLPRDHRRQLKQLFKTAHKYLFLRRQKNSRFFFFAAELTDSSFWEHHRILFSFQQRRNELLLQQALTRPLAFSNIARNKAFFKAHNSDKSPFRKENVSPDCRVVSPQEKESDSFSRRLRTTCLKIIELREASPASLL